MPDRDRYNSSKRLRNSTILARLNAQVRIADA